MHAGPCLYAVQVPQNASKTERVPNAACMAIGLSEERELHERLSDRPA